MADDKRNQDPQDRSGIGQIGGQASNSGQKGGQASRDQNNQGSFGRTNTGDDTSLNDEDM